MAGSTIVLRSDPYLLQRIHLDRSTNHKNSLLFWCFFPLSNVSHDDRSWALMILSRLMSKKGKKIPRSEEIDQVFVIRFVIRSWSVWWLNKIILLIQVAYWFVWYWIIQEGISWESGMFTWVICKRICKLSIFETLDQFCKLYLFIRILYHFLMFRVTILCITKINCSILRCITDDCTWKKWKQCLIGVKIKAKIARINLTSHLQTNFNSFD